MAGVNGDGTVDLWDAHHYVALGSIKVSDLPLTAAAFSTDQRRLLIADEDGEIRSISVGGTSWQVSPADWPADRSRGPNGCST